MVKIGYQIGCASVPGQSVKRFSFGVRFSPDNGEMFFQFNGPFLFIFRLWPLRFWDNGTTKPIHVEGKIVHAVQINVC
jgi:hypothetical protein